MTSKLCAWVDESISVPEDGQNGNGLYVLAAALANLGVSDVSIEARTESLNRRDMRMLDALRSRGTLAAGLAVTFARPIQEPMLWLPDAIAGAVSAHLRGRDSHPYELLKRELTVHRITMR